MKKARSMSDARDLSTPEHLPLSSDETAPVTASAGSLLRQAREAAGLHIATLAVLLKVPVKRLEALEADRFDLLPDAVFARALASSVCRNLKIDSAVVLEKLPQASNSNMAHQSRGINTPFRESGDSRVGPSLWAQVSRPAMLAGLVLLLGAVVLIFLPAFRTAMDAKSVDVFLGDTDKQPVVSPAMETAAGNVSATPQEPQLLSPPMPPPVVPSQSAVISAVPAPDRAASTAASTVSTGIVVFTAKGASWVQVSDAKGTVVLRRTLAPGEVAGATGALPLSAIVGKADATQVQIRGNAFDLSAVAKDNVARFEVK
ncbi:MAG: helix-turn-helix domain-containing protein [Polaromonas sp.]|nr:MAG: helix-turn-helix domain-containing protein [Polaromonas sp.]